MKLLDLFCGAGGAAMGYFQAGFTDITGVDIAPQPHYPFKFIQAEALEYLKAHGREYDFIHASPPCQAYSRCQFLPQNAEVKKTYPKLIEPIRTQLVCLKKSYIIENVPGAPLLNPVRNTNVSYLNKPLKGIFTALRSALQESDRCSQPVKYPYNKKGGEQHRHVRPCWTANGE